MMKKALRAALFVLPAIFLGLALTGLPADARDDSIALRARTALTELDVTEARRLLSGADPERPAVLLERGRLAIYEMDYDAAVTILSHPTLTRSAMGAELLEIAQASARATAAAVVHRDEGRGIVLRLQHEDDEALVPWIFDVAEASRARLEADLGTDLPRPLRIELVRDQQALSAMTGLPEEAARTTGTVAIAKWGRVTMLSPRALSRGYAWADTLAHELAHLMQTRASRDRAPLWLQEGVAKREETRWREPRELDDFPSSDVVAKIGFERKLARPIDQLGASIAMLPSAEEARVAFAEVASFVGYWMENAGDSALPSLLAHLKTARTAEDLDQAMTKASGATLAEWNAQWMGWLQTRAAKIPQHLEPGGKLQNAADVRRNAQLGELLRERGHHRSAEKYLRRAHELAPHDALIRHHLAHALEAEGQKSEAEALVSKIEDVHSEVGAWFALHGRYARERGEDEEAEGALGVGVWLDPLNAEVACEGKTGADLPVDSRKAALCQRARASLRD